MKTRKTRAGEAGFTLLEALIAMAILCIGILAVCMMQGSALRASTTSFKRTEATNVALALAEALQQLPSDDPMLTSTGSGSMNSAYETGNGGTKKVKLDGGESGGVMPSMEEVMEGNASVHRCRNNGKKCASDDGGETSLETLLESAFETQDDGKVKDRTGCVFELAWAVQDVMVEGVEKNGAPSPTDKLIRIYMRWDTPMGIKNHLEFTTNKFSRDIND